MPHREFEPEMGWQLIQKLVDADLLPKNCSHAVIDIPADGLVTFHYTTYADSNKLGVLPAALREAALFTDEIPDEPVQFEQETLEEP